MDKIAGGEAKKVRVDKFKREKELENEIENVAKRERNGQEVNCGHYKMER